MPSTALLLLLCLSASLEILPLSVSPLRTVAARDLGGIFALQGCANLHAICAYSTADAVVLRLRGGEDRRGEDDKYPQPPPPPLPVPPQVRVLVASHCVCNPLSLYHTPSPSGFEHVNSCINVMYVYFYLHKYVHIYMYVCLYICVYISICAYICTYIIVYVYIYIYIYIKAHIRICVCVYVSVYACV